VPSGAEQERERNPPAEIAGNGFYIKIYTADFYNLTGGENGEKKKYI
jgi:hypothetical protein